MNCSHLEYEHNYDEMLKTVTCVFQILKIIKFENLLDVQNRHVTEGRTVTYIVAYYGKYVCLFCLDIILGMTII